MRRLLLSSALCACLAACGAPAPPPPHANVALPVVKPQTPPPPAPVPDDPAAAYALGYTWWQSGRQADALRAFHSVIATLVREDKDKQQKRKGRGAELRVGPGAESAMAVEKGRVVISTTDGVLLADGKTGAIERFVPLRDAGALQALGEGLVAILAPDEAALLDVASGSLVARVAHAQGITQHRTLFAIYGNTGNTDADAFAELWDATKRTRLRTFHDATLQTLYGVDFSSDARALFARGGDHGVIWDVATGAPITSYQAIAGVTGLPAFSDDGRFIAYGSVDFDKNPTVGTTYLFDAQSRRVAATSHASHMPTGFAFSGSWLAVGDLRRACLLRVPQMTQAACSAEVRPFAGPDDDLQDAHPTFVASSTALVIPTSDGSVLVASVPSMATLWKGRARLAQAPDGTSYLADEDQHELYAIGNKGAVVHARALGEDESVERLRETHPSAADDDAAQGRVANATCHAGSWVFPAAACAR